MSLNLPNLLEFRFGRIFAIVSWVDVWVEIASLVPTSTIRSCNFAPHMAQRLPLINTFATLWSYTIC